MMSKMEEVTVSSKGQIVIPKEIRERLGIKPGKELLIKESADSITLIPKPRNPLEQLIKLGREAPMGDMRKEIKEARKEWKR